MAFRDDSEAIEQVGHSPRQRSDTLSCTPWPGTCLEKHPQLPQHHRGTKNHWEFHHRFQLEQNEIIEDENMRVITPGLYELKNYDKGLLWIPTGAWQCFLWFLCLTHSLLQPIPKTSHFNTDDCSTEGFKKNQAPLLRAEHKLGESPGQDPECPTKASNFRHSSKGHLRGKVAEVTAVLTELQPTQLWPHY